MQHDRDKLINELLLELHKVAPADQKDDSLVYIPTSNAATSIRRRRSKHEKTMHKCIHTAYAVVDKMSEAGSVSQAPSTIADDEQWSTDAETDISDGGSDGERSPAVKRIPPDKFVEKDGYTRPTVEYIEEAVSPKTEHFGEDASDAELEFDNSTPRDVLHTLIENYEKHANTACDSCQYNQAEEHQRRMIEYAEEWNSLYRPSKSMQAMKERLAESLKEQGTQAKLAESEKIFKDALSSSRSEQTLSPPPPQSPYGPLDQATAVDRSNLYYKMAEINFIQHQKHQKSKALQKSAIYAKQSFKLRLPFRTSPGSGFQKTVELFIQILELQGRPVDAETYRTLFLQANALPPTPPSIHGRIPSLSPRAPSFSFEDPDGIDLEGRPYLIAAIMSNNLDRIDALLNHQANPEIVYADKSALMHAVDSGSVPIVSKLQTWGASIDFDPSPRGIGYTALHYAISQVNPTMVDALLSHGASTELSYQDHTPLQRAARIKYPELIPILIRHGAAINATDADGFTPLHLALRGEGGTETAQLLLHHNADPNVRCSDSQRTPLHYTIVDNNPGAAEVLLSRVPFVDLEIEDGSGRTAATLAVLHNRYELLTMLLAEGAMVQRGKLPNELPMNVERLLKKTERERGKAGGLARTESVASSTLETTTSRKSSIIPWRRRSSRNSFGGA